LENQNESTTFKSADIVTVIKINRFAWLEHVKNGWRKDGTEATAGQTGWKEKKRKT
jgi:hypothetical protein